MKTFPYTTQHLVRLAVLGLAFVAMTGAGCTVLLGIDSQCDNDQECKEKFGPDKVCRQGLCVASRTTDTGSNTNNGTDTETETTETRTGMDLLSKECSQLHGMDDPTQLVPSNAILIGAILPLSGELAVPGGYFDHATVLANEELNRVGGIQGRPILMLTCDSGTSPSGAATAAVHLRDLGVQAVLGPFASELVLFIYLGVLKEAGMMVATAGASAPLMAQVSQEGLIWSTSLPTAREAMATAQHLHNNSWEKVAVVYRNDTWGSSMLNAFLGAYCEGQGANCDDPNKFSARGYAVSDLQSSLSTTLTQVAAWGPDVTVGFSYAEDALTFFELNHSQGAPLKSMLWNSPIASEVVFELLSEPAYPVLCQIQATTQKMPAGLVYTAFRTRYMSRWNGEEPAPYTAAFYDAAYMLAYAYAAASRTKTNPTGVEIGAAMNRLSSGTAFQAGPEQWIPGVTALRASDTSTIDYVGASGDVNFPEGTGSVEAPVEAIRLNVTKKTIESLGIIYTAAGKYTAPDFSKVKDSVCGEFIQP